MAIVTACVKKALAAGLFVVSLMGTANAFAQGSEYNYLLHCGGCHIEDGSGMPPHIPDLRVEMPLFAASTEGRAYIARVPGVIQAPMDTQQLTEVLNLLLSRFAPEGSNLQPFSEEEITLYQQEALLDPKKLRDQLLAQISDSTQSSDHLNPDN
jgi:cytochrome c peroxidase